MSKYDCAFIEEPSQFLIENIDILPKGQALDLAMGGGRNSVYLALHGFNVEGVDVSLEAINQANELASKSGVKIKTEVADLETGYKIQKHTYDLIICIHYLQRSLFQDIKDGLKDSGMIVYETYIVDQAKLGKPKNPDHLLKHNELLDIFRDFRCLRYREGIFQTPRGKKAFASIIAQKSA